MSALKAPARLAGNDRDWSSIRGFNYQPSYGSTGIELWQKFDAKIIENELARGKKYFPGINALRWWQSWDSYVRDPAAYLRKFEHTLELASRIGCAVVPVLFNRWHDFTLDYGGIYTEHFFPANDPWRGNIFDSYLESLVGAHKDDPRILAWDLCNEPYPHNQRSSDICKSEATWLKSIHDVCKCVGTSAPLTVGIHPLTPLEQVDPISDVLSIHPYWMHQGCPHEVLSGHRYLYDAAAYEEKLNAEVAYARKANKPLIATECCWGDLNEKPRVAGIRYTFDQLKRRGIGWTAYLLHHSLIADAHRPEYGPLGVAGNLAFIEADGSLRQGHDIFNEF